MALGAFRFVRNFRRVGGDLSNDLAGVAGIRAYGCGLFSAFNGDLANLLCREDGHSIPTPPANGKGHAVEARVVATVLCLRRGTNAVST